MSEPTLPKDEINPEGWRLSIDRAVTRFVKKTGVKREDLSRAMGLYPASLYRSHLLSTTRGNGEDYRNRIVFAMNADNLYQVARQLMLSDQAVLALKELFYEVYQQVLGLDLDFGSLRATLRDAVELGLLAAEQFDTDQWDSALSRLHQAWDVLTQTSDCSERVLLAKLQVGTRLMAWQDAQGTTHSTIKLGNALFHPARVYTDNNPLVLDAIGKLYRAYSMSSSHLNVEHPERIIKRLKKAAAIQTDGVNDRTGNAPDLRDMAKSYFLWGLGGKVEAINADRLRDAREVVEESEQILGGKNPPQELRQQWFLSRLTRIEILALQQLLVHRDPHTENEIDTLWGEFMDESWVIDMKNKPFAPLQGKLLFAQSARLLAKGDHFTIHDILQTYINAPPTTQTPYHVQRAKDLLSMISTENFVGLSTIYLR